MTHAMQAPVRRVVTGEGSDGTAVVVSDAEVTGEPPRVGVVLHDLWGSDAPLTLPADGSRPSTEGITPPPGGFRFALVSFVSREEVLGGGMHRSDTVDVGIVVSGEIWIELDDGAETLLRTGDCLVQHGTIHAWHNRTDEPWRVRDGRSRSRAHRHLMDTALAGRAAIVGIGQTEFSRGAGRGVNQLAAEAAIAAIDDAGIDVSVVDGTVTFSGDGTDDLQLIRNIGAAELRWTSRTRWRRRFVRGDQHAAAAVAAGAADHVLVYRSLTQATDRTHRPGQARTPGGAPTQGYRGPYAPFGLQVPAHIYSLWFQRYMYRFGLTNEDFGRYSVVARKHAATNPAAYFYGRPITLEDHQNSRWIVEPILRLLDCCQTNDGAVALIVTTPERVPLDLPGQSVIVEATSQSHLRDGDELHDYYLGDRTEFAEATSLGRRLYQAAGLTPDDIDTAMIYENFSPLVFLQLEAFGFCGVGEARTTSSTATSSSAACSRSTPTAACSARRTSTG